MSNQFRSYDVLGWIEYEECNLYNCKEIYHNLKMIHSYIGFNEAWNICNTFKKIKINLRTVLHH